MSVDDKEKDLLGENMENIQSNSSLIDKNNKDKAMETENDTKIESKEESKEESKIESKIESKEDIEVDVKKDKKSEKKKKSKKAKKNKKDVDEEYHEFKFDKRFFKEVVNTILMLLACIAIAKMINSFIIVNARVPSASMETTIMTNDRLVANRLAYVFDTPERGDIVVFEAPDDPEKLYIKRVIGTPGDKVEIVDGYLYLNDQLVDEPYLKEPMVGSFGPYYVPEDNYFMLGDNRNNSLDARYWRNTYVPEDTILGKAVFTYYPKIQIIE